MKDKVIKFYQIRNMPADLRQGIKVAAALAGVSMTDWIITTLRRAVRAAGVLEDGE